MSIKQCLERYTTIPELEPQKTEASDSIELFATRKKLFQRGIYTFHPGSLYPLINLFLEDHTADHPHWKISDYAFKHTSCMKWLIDTYREEVMLAEPGEKKARHRFFTRVIQENKAYLDKVNFNFSSFNQTINALNQEAQINYHRKLNGIPAPTNKSSECLFQLYQAISPELPNVDWIQTIFAGYIYDSYRTDVDFARANAVIQSILNDKHIRDKNFQLMHGFY